MLRLFILVTLSFLASHASAMNPPTENSTTQAPTESKIPKDYYQTLGMPALTQAWTPNNYLQVANVLAPVAQRSPEYLPHYGDKTAEPYMKHMVNGQNFYQVLQFANSQQARIDLIIIYLDGVQRLLSIYQQVLSKENPYYAEWLDLIALCSYLTALSTPELLMTSNGYNDPNNAAKREAANILLNAMVSPVITGIEALPRLSPILAWRLVQQLSYSMPSYAQSLPLSSQQQIYNALLAAFQQTQNQQLREALQKLAMLYTQGM